MVAGSRSSLRRPSMRGDPTLLTSSSPLTEQNNNTLRSRRSTLALQSKRGRSSTLSELEQDQKRRKITDSHSSPQLRIPLRGRFGLPQAVSPNFVTQSVPVPEIPPRVPQPSQPLDSPTTTPQYDQIRIIEEKARASIRDGVGTQSQPPEERRKLRSEHGGSRSKTELAQYFPYFEDMLSLEPPDPDLLTARTRLILIDDTPGYRPPDPRPDPFGTNKPLHNTKILDLSIPSRPKNNGGKDPLNADVYLKIHRKAERHEKQMKNGDKERAQHEKYQLEKLLDDLRGPDWLKTLGISGITDTEKKRYESKRSLFIRETQALINKFKWWKEEEKRRKLEREQALLEEATENEGSDEHDEDSRSTPENHNRRSTSTQAPDSSELDALASQQLLEEAKSASKRRKPTMAATVVPEPPPYLPFTSFFAKRHLRDAAISGRQRGRVVLAFGHPVPELEEGDFELPNTILTEDAIRASQRHRRRVRRGVDD